MQDATWSCRMIRQKLRLHRETSIHDIHAVGNQPIKGGDPHIWESRLVHLLGTG